MDEHCIYSVNYTVTLEDSNFHIIVQQMESGSDICEKGVCSTSIFPLLPSLLDKGIYYRMSVFATNSLGSSNSLISDSDICESDYFKTEAL